MSEATLTGRERVNRMFAREDHDRIPRYDTYWNETLDRWTGEGLIGRHDGALNLLETDFHSIGVAWPAPFPGQREVLEETGDTEVFRDHWGAIVRYWKHKSGTPEHIGFECDTREKWEAIYKPALVNSPLQIDIKRAKSRYEEGRKAGRWVLWHSAESFEVTRKIMGDEIILMAMADDPEWVRDISQTYTDRLLQEYDAIWNAGLQVDGIFNWGDMAYNRNTFCSPRMYRNLIWPDHKRMADWAHERGLKLIYHTDGNVTRVLDLYIEAGIDCLQPLEAKASMDIRQLSPEYGDRLAFMGNIDVMKMIPNDRDIIEEEIKSKFAAGMATKGYTYHSDHSVPPQVSLETYKTIISLIDRYGSYA